MPKNLDSLKPTVEPSDTAAPTSEAYASAAHALARRRMLVKSLGKGSAVVAAASAPMHVLASLSITANNTDPTLNGRRCTISGGQSGVHSKETTTFVCAGKSPGYYHMINHWPGYVSGAVSPTYNVGNISFNSNSTFSSVFGPGSGLGSIKLFDFFTSAYANTGERHWVAALLNALPNSQAINFPYTAAQVIALYSGPQSAAALAFFKTYMELV